jgi:integrase
VATLYKRGPSYYLNWRRDGKQYRRTLGPIDRKAAEAVRAEKEAELAGLITSTRGVTVEHVLADYLSWYETERPATFGRARSALKPLRESLGAYGAEAATARAFERWAAGRPQATAEKALKLARAAFRRAVNQRVISRSPMDGVSIPKTLLSRPPDYYRPAQLAKLYKTARGDLWAFMASTGLRRGEMVKARRTDVQGGLLVIESTTEGRTKSGKWRAVPLNPQAKAALKGLGADRLADCHADTLGDWFKVDAAEAGLPGTLHWLRHTFCTALVQSGVSLHEVQRLAGHSSVAVTERYAHHAPDFGRAAVATMAGWMRKGLAKKHTGKHTKPTKHRRPRSSAG